MKRQSRNSFLSKLEVLVREKGISRCKYLILRQVSKKEIRYLISKLHPGDYSKDYPGAVKLLTSLCRKDSKDDKWGFMAADISSTLNRYAVVNDCAAYSDIITQYSRLLEMRPGEWVKRFRSLIRYSDINPEILDMVFNYLEKSNFDENTIDELKKKLSKENLEHQESLTMILDVFKETKKKEAN